MKFFFRAYILYEYIYIIFIKFKILFYFYIFDILNIFRTEKWIKFKSSKPQFYEISRYASPLFSIYTHIYIHLLFNIQYSTIKFKIQNSKFNIQYSIFNIQYSNFIIHYSIFYRYINILILINSI